MDPRWRLLAGVAGCGLLLVVGVKLVWPLAAPFLLGLVLACAIGPLVQWCRRRCGFPPWLATGGVLALVLLLLGIFLAFLGLSFWTAARRAVLDSMQSGGLAWLGADLLQRGEAMVSSLPEAIRPAALGLLGRIPLWLVETARQILSGLGRAPSWLLTLFLGVLAAYYFSRDRAVISRLLVNLTPLEWRAGALGMKEEILRLLNKIIQSYLILLGLTFVLGIVGALVIGIKHPLLFGLVLAMLDFLPMIGPGVLLLPWAGLSFLAGAWGQGVGLILLFAFHSLLRQWVEFRLIGRNLGLHPLAALAAIYVGWRLFGLGGFFLGPGLLIILRALYLALALPGRRTISQAAAANEVGHEAYFRARFHGLHRTANP